MAYFSAGQILTAAALNAALSDVPPNTVVYTASGTFTSAQAAGAKALRVRVVGGGGGSAGAVATAAGQNSVGGGGSGGGYAESILNIASVTFPVTVTVAAGGAAGGAGLSGGNASANSFGTYVVAGGGFGGGASAVSAVAALLVNPLPGGSGTTGQILTQGSQSQAAIMIAVGTMSCGTPGQSIMSGVAQQVGNVSANGVAGQIYGGGAAGALNMASSAAKTGAAGGIGVVIVEILH